MSTDLAAVSTDLESLAPASREAALTVYLTGARDSLAMALDLSGPAEVAAIKAEIATMAEAAKQLGLSKEIQLDAQEMVRRGEYALGKAIRKGQDEGVVSDKGNRANYGGPHHRQSLDRTLSSPAEWLRTGEERAQTYAISDNVSAAEFDDVLAEARAEGNLSRANVVRKANAIKGKDLSVVTACGIDNSFAEGLRAAKAWLEALVSNPTPEQAEALATVLRRYLKKVERNLP